MFLRPQSYRNITTGISPSYSAATTPPSSLAVERNATRSAHYRALLFSTGAHFSSRHFNLPDGPVTYAVPVAASPESGAPAAAASTGVGNAQVEFFELVVDAWAARVSAALEAATPEEREGKVVLVRPSSGGHNDCHSATRPVQDGEEAQSNWYSWADMAVMNVRAEVRRLSPCLRLRKSGSLTPPRARRRSSTSSPTRKSPSSTSRTRPAFDQTP